MARKAKDPDPGKSPAQSKEERAQAREERRQARAQAGSGAAARTKPGRSRPGRAQPTRARAAKGATAGDDTAIEARLASLEQAVALQAERSEELLEKVEAMLAESNQGSDS
jgi:hypothetical protein